MKRSEWIYPALFLGVLFAGYGLVPLPREREKADSFNLDRGGKKAFFDLATELLPLVKRSSASLVPDDPEADVLVLLGPARYPDRAQWQTLHDWVSGGRALVFAAKWQDPAIDLEPFGIEVVPNLAFGPIDREGEDGEEPPAEAAPPSPETELVAGPVDFRSQGYLRYTDPQTTILLQTGGSPQVIWRPVGDGLIVVASSDFLFSNLSMTEPSNALLAFRILETASPSGTVYFDEWLNEAGGPNVVGVLFEGPLRLPVLQLLLVTVLFGWMSSRRFGPIIRRGLSERRSLVEHAEALGSLHFRVGTSGSLIGSYLEYFAKDLGVSYRTGAKGRREMAIAEGRSPGKDAPEVLASAIRAASHPKLDRSRVASTVRALAGLRAARKGATS